MAITPPITFEQRSFQSGMNAVSLPGSMIRADEMSLIINGTVRNGFIKTRPGWRVKSLAFLTPKAQLVFENGKYQGSCYYMSPAGDVMMYVVDGYLFSYDPNTGIVAIIGEKPLFSKFSPHVWMIQRNKWLIAQDGQSPPAVYSGGEVTQEVTPTGVPLGTIMVEGWHRLAVVSADRRRIYFSDHELDPNSTPISFTEGTDYYANARYFEAPPSLGRIMGAAFTPFQDTSTGIGPLLIFCEHGTRAYNISIPRSLWVTADISQTILPNVGSSSFFAYADRGSQLVFRDHEGRIRTVKNAQQTEDTNSNYSNDFVIHPLIGWDDQTLRHYNQALTFDNRTLVLVHPKASYLQDNRYDVVHSGIAVLENETLSEKPDVWVFWTGKDICGFNIGKFNDEETLLAFTKKDGKNSIDQLTKSGMDDYTVTSKGLEIQRIKMRVAPAYHDYGLSALLKTMENATMVLSDMTGDVSITGTWEIDSKPPEPWFTHVEKHRTCLQFSSCGIEEKASGTNPRLVLPAVPQHLQRFYKAKPTFEIVGTAQLELLNIVVTGQPPTLKTNVSCAVPTMPALVNSCNSNILK